MFKSDDPGNQEQDREQGKRPPVYEIKRIVEIREARVLRYDKMKTAYKASIPDKIPFTILVFVMIKNLPHVK